MHASHAISPLTVHLRYSEEDEIYIATSPEWPGISADGESVQEAVNELMVAISAAVEVAEKYGDPIPDADPILDKLYHLRDYMKASKIAKDIGINENTFRSKLRRGSEFKPDEAARLRGLFEELGVSL